MTGLWPEATRPGISCGKVSSCSRTKVGSGPDFRDGDVESTEIYWPIGPQALERVSNKGYNFENDALEAREVNPWNTFQ